MPDTITQTGIRISELPEATSVSDTDLLETSQTDGTKLTSRSVTRAQIVAGLAVASDMTSLLALKANIASPTFTGDPKAPTPLTTDNDTSVATTAFVRSAISTYSPAPDLSGYATTTYVNTQDALKVAKAGDTMTGPLLMSAAPNTTPISITGYSLTGTDTHSAYKLVGTINTPSGPNVDVFSIDVTNTSNNSGNVFRIRTGPTSGSLFDAMLCDMAGDLKTSGHHTIAAQFGLPTGGDTGHALYFGNSSGGNTAIIAGTGLPTQTMFGTKPGSLYLHAGGDGVPYINTDGGTTYDKLVSETATQTLLNKSATTPTAGDNTTKIATTAFVTGALSGAGVYIGTSAPSSPTAGKLWWQSELGMMFVYYDDGTGAPQWVPTAPSPSMSGVLQLYSEQVCVGGETVMNVTIPLNAKRVELDISVRAASGDQSCLLQTVESGVANATNNHMLQDLYGSGASATAGQPAIATSWNIGGWIEMKGLYKFTPRFNFGTWAATAVCHVITAASARYVVTRMIDGGASPATTTGFRVTIGGSSWIAGSFMRAYVVT